MTQWTYPLQGDLRQRHQVGRVQQAVAKSVVLHQQFQFLVDQYDNAMTSCFFLFRARFYEVSSGFTEFYLVLPSFTKFYRVLLSFTEFFWVSLGFNGF